MHPPCAAHVGVILGSSIIAVRIVESICSAFGLQGFGVSFMLFGHRLWEAADHRTYCHT